MRTPLTYYGGKQLLTAKITALIPAHKTYVEPFIGGAAIYFAKVPSQCEVINDTNGELINFYEVMKRDFPALQSEIQISLHSRKQYSQAEVIYNNPDMFDRVKRAWAVWMLANTSYGAKLDGGWGYDRKGKFPAKIARKCALMTLDYGARLQNTQIECCDALRIIGSRDAPDTFFYCDPPYVGADQGHYDGYSQEDFDRLLDVLAKAKGKFLLSSYRNKTLDDFVERHGWDKTEYRMSNTMTCSHTPRKKIEVLTANFSIHEKMQAQ